MGKDGEGELAAAVEALLADAGAEPGVEARTEEEAAWAVRLFDDRLHEGPELLRQVAERAQQGAETISSDRLQVLSEMVQNADDAGAREVRIRWRPTELLVAHNGGRLRLADLPRLGLPWLSGKSLDAESTGRFGIGLATIRLLSTTWEVHGPPYRVRFADVTMTPAEAPHLPQDIAGPEWTVFRIPLETDVLSADEVLEWFEDWQDASLLFLRHLDRVTVDTDDSAGVVRTRVLRLTWQEVTTLTLPVGGERHEVRVREAWTTEDKCWRVYDVLIPSRPGWHRMHKRLGPTVPVAVALPLCEGERGNIHAGLPVAPLAVPARVHSQFDPVVSREGFAASTLNAALVPVVADLWQAAVLDLLGRVEPSAWHLLPLPGTSAPARAGLPDRLFGAFLERARNQVAAVLALPVPEGPAVPLADLAVEVEELTGVISPRDTARLASLEHDFPDTARDVGGRWREVLSDWRTAGTAGLPGEVRVVDALGLLQQPAYDIDRTVRLTAVALKAGLDYRLIHFPCLATADGRRLAPAGAGHAFAHDRGTGPLDPLGALLDLHPGYWSGEDAARRVTTWLAKHNCLIHRDDTAAVLRHIARLGETGSRLPATDLPGAERLVLLQQAVGALTKPERDRLGRGIGRTLLLDAFEYGADGVETARQARPEEIYLPQALESTDGDRFAAAARRTAGLLWAHRGYAKTLLPASQSGGLSRTAFLRLLGVADTPRLNPILEGRAVKRYEVRDSRVGLSRDAGYAPSGRRRAMVQLGAKYTLDDRSARDLDRVVKNIGAERDGVERRRRTVALLQTLGKPGMVTSPEQATVRAATDMRGWIEKGSVPALWVWRLRDSAWLEDASGVLRRPDQLQLRTPDAEALYGQDEPNYLHPEIQRALAGRIDVLTAIGVAGDPDVPQLVERVRQLRKRPVPVGAALEELRAEAYLVYRALARRLAERPADIPRADLERGIRAAFQGADSLILTDTGWRRPDECLRGTTILRGMRAFVPPGPELLPLWQVLDIKEPRSEDLVDVLKELAAAGEPTEENQQRLMLEALRSLNNLVGGAGTTVTPGLRAKLRWLPLWTTSGWIKPGRLKDQPVYAVSAHLTVERALSGRVPLWQPGGDAEQFTDLVGLLGVHVLDTAAAQVVEPDGALPDPGLTADLARAVIALQDRLVRDEPAVADSFTDWDGLTRLEVRILPGLRVRLDVGHDREPLEVPVGAHVDHAAKALFLAAPDELRTRLGTGAALACLFTGSRAQVARHWRDFWEEDDVTTGHAVPITSAGQRDVEEQRRRDELLRERSLRAANAATRVDAAPATTPRPARGARRRAPQTAAPLPVVLAPVVPSPRPAGGGSATPPGAAPNPVPASTSPVQRRLVGLDRLGRPTSRQTASSAGPARRSAGMQPPRSAGGQGSGLSAPRPGGAVPRRQAAPLGYRDDSKEELVIGLLAAVLGEEADSIDQRGGHNIGADAVDSTGRYYEIKAHGGSRPNEVTLTTAEFLRAREQGENYVLLLAEHLEEGSGGDPTLIMISDPLSWLDVQPVSDIRLKGTRATDVEATVWTWPTL
ncbi:hypothetical protein [Kitasatospora sp. NPDC048538]|uniref:sacsin N-terminal ATP-binding-like domain-containing protein n=1 Tax=unclassified Kitasatospora TaxID=2633591 RepID=UPI0033C8D0F6